MKFNLANLVTTTRPLILIPFYLYLSSGRSLQAAAFLIILALMDKVDGMIARGLKQESKLGSVMDKAADWLVFASLLAILLYLDIIEFYWLYIIGLALASALVGRVLYGVKKKTTDATWLGKATVIASYLIVLWLIFLPQHSNYLMIGISILSYVTVASFFVKAYSQ